MLQNISLVFRWSDSGWRWDCGLCNRGALHAWRLCQTDQQHWKEGEDVPCYRLWPRIWTLHLPVLWWPGSRCRFTRCVTSAAFHWTQYCHMTKISSHPFIFPQDGWQPTAKDWPTSQTHRFTPPGSLRVLLTLLPEGSVCSWNISMDLSAIRFATCSNYLHWTQTQTFLLKNFETLDTIYCYPQKIENYLRGLFWQVFGTDCFSFFLNVPINALCTLFLEC